MFRDPGARTLAAVCLFSAALIGLELAVMRTFSVGSWSNFGHMVISIALLGFGLSGTLLTFIQSRIEGHEERWLFATAMLFMPAAVLAHVFAQHIDFNPVLITTDRKQLLNIAAYYVAYGVPFFIGATFIGVSFIALRDRIHKLYFWNMLGSGLGGLLMLPVMFLVPPERLVVPICVASFLAASAFCWYEDEQDGRPALDTLRLGGNLLCGVFAVALLVFAGDIKVSQYKGISYAWRFPDAKRVAHAYGPMGEIDVIRSSMFHFAPGLSDNAAFEVRRMPDNAYMGLFIDGGGPIGVIRRLQPEETAYMDFLPMSAAYQVLRQPRTLLVQLGGGISASVALHNSASQVTVVESNPQIIGLVRDNATLRQFNGDLLRDPRVRVVSGDARAWAATTKERFDLVEVSLIDSTGLSATGGYSLDESYIYTVEGVRDYLGCLKPEGILSLTVWNKLNPPRNVPKLLATVVRALGRSGTGDPKDRVFFSHYYLSTATILAKQSPFTPDELARLRAFNDRLSFDVVYDPGRPPKDTGFEKVLAAFRDFYRPLAASSEEGSASSLDLGSLYAGCADWLLRGRSAELFREYVFDVRPATDDRPYFTAYLKPRTLPVFLRELDRVSEEWGYVLLWGTLAQSAFFGLLIIALPLILRWRELFSGKRGTVGVIVYFSCLGLAYMLIEMVLIQKLVLFLAAPIYSVSIVITSMLILSGLGSRFSSRFAARRARGIWLAVAVIVPAMLFYAFLVDPILRACLPAPLIVKAVLAVVLMAPAAFFMGFPFPSGLSALSASRPQLLPWAWGTNGALSVTGAVLARLLSISFGFAAVLLVAAGAYLVAGVVFRANEG
jgi:spermidine synthase